MQELVYDRSAKGYRLSPVIRQVLSNEEVFVVLKILLESRAFTKQELNPILDKLIECCVPKEKKRMDRITSFEILPEHFHVPYQDRFEEGEFRKRVQFMYGGRLQKIRFWFKGPSIEAVLDRLPTAQIIEHNEKGYLISAEVFGKGIEMWLRSQGPWIERVE
ncbi:MAG: WYL domain-containing protein [Phascolarctobacterium sp.]